MNPTTTPTHPQPVHLSPAEVAWLAGYAAGRADAQREREGRLGVTRMQGGRK
jgi:hypothetical protein